MPQVTGIQFVERLTHTVWRVILSIIVSAPLAGVVAGGAVEAVSALTTHQFPGPILTHVLALVFAIVTAYSVALTYAVIECTMGAVRIARMLDEDINRNRTLIERTLMKPITARR